MGNDMFTAALMIVLALEGFYSNDAGDAGGETVYGIARNYHPTWRGWGLIDKAKASPQGVGQLKGAPDIMAAVGEFYRANFWNPCGCDQMPPKVAAKVFEIAVNCGTAHPVKLVQTAVTVYTNVEGIKVDGVIGPKTLAALAQIDEGVLLESIRSNQVVFYEDIVKRNPGQRKFVVGWTRRART